MDSDWKSEKKGMSVSEHEEMCRLKIRAFILPSVRFDNPIFGSFYYMILLRLHKFVGCFSSFSFFRSKITFWTSNTGGLHENNYAKGYCVYHSNLFNLSVFCYFTLIFAPNFAHKNALDSTSITFWFCHTKTNPFNLV